MKKPVYAFSGKSEQFSNNNIFVVEIIFSK